MGWGLCPCFLRLSRPAEEDIVEEWARGCGRKGLGSEGPERVDWGGRGTQDKPVREHLLIPQVFIEPLLCAGPGLGDTPT